MHLKVFGVITLSPQQATITAWKQSPDLGFWTVAKNKSQNKELNMKCARNGTVYVCTCCARCILIQAIYMPNYTV